MEQKDEEICCAFCYKMWEECETLLPVVFCNDDEEELCCKDCWISGDLEDQGYATVGDDFSDDEDEDEDEEADDEKQ
jgi:hypothetical protein